MDSLKAYRRKRILRLVILLFVLLAIAVGVGSYIKKTYTVQTVYVEGNVHYTEEEIKAIVMDGPLGDNSLYLSLKYRNKGITNIPFVDVIDVEILDNDRIKISVIEKILTGYVKFLDTYMYFDKDGYVVESSSQKTAGVPQITGLVFDHVVKGMQLPVEDKDVFTAILNITKLLNKYELTADKIYFSGAGDMVVYFADVKVALGNEKSTLEDKLMRLPELLPSLEGMDGTLQMSVYNEKGTYTFKPD